MLSNLKVKSKSTGVDYLVDLPTPVRGTLSPVSRLDSRRLVQVQLDLSVCLNTFFFIVFV